MSEAIVPVLSVESSQMSAEVIPTEWISDDAAELIGSERNPRLLIEDLLSSHQSIDALKCVAQLLPKHYVLVWGISTIRDSKRVKELALTDADRAGLALANRWLSDSTEESRMAAQQFAEADGFASPGGWIAAAAGWMGGSLGPPEYEPIAPPSNLPGEAVAASLVMLAAREPAQIDEILTEWVRDALEAFGGKSQGEQN